MGEDELACEGPGVLIPLDRLAADCRLDQVVAVQERSDLTARLKFVNQSQELKIVPAHRPLLPRCAAHQEGKQQRTVVTSEPPFDDKLIKSPQLVRRPR